MSRTPVTLRNALVAFSALGSVLVLLMAWGAPAQAALTYPSSGESFGQEGTGAGAFRQVIGVATRPSAGEVFVYDGEQAGQGRVYKFDASGNPVDFSGLGKNYIEGVGGTFGSEGEIAVDDSSGSDAGDIYVANNNVVKIYAASGLPLGELTGGEFCGVAVDPSGAVYVGDYTHLSVRKYTPSVNPVTDFDETTSMGGLDEPCNVAVDGAGNVYAATYSGGVRRYESSQFGSSSATGTLVDASGSTMSVNPETGDLFVDEGSQVTEFDAAGSQLGISGTGTLGESFGVALGAGDGGKMYAGSATRVDVLGPVVALPEESADVPGFSGATLLLKGSVDPGGNAVTSCQFEYGTSAGVLSSTVACSPDPGSASEPVEVLGSVNGLTEGTTYFYRLTVANAFGSTQSVERAFVDPGPPSVTDASFSEVGSSSAIVTAKVNPNGAPTKFVVEYGTTASYGAATASVNAGASTEPVGVQAHIEGLQPGATYHFRFVASSPVAGAEGVDTVFSTLAPSLLGLPDGRGYEMVTPAGNEGVQAYVPNGDDRINDEAINTLRPVRAAADGNAVAYVGDPNAEGNGSQGKGFGNEYLATRSASGGWVQENLQPLGLNSPVYAGFSSDLSVGFLTSSEPLAADAPEGYEVLYGRDNGDGSIHPLYTVTPPNRASSEYGAASLGRFSKEEVGISYAAGSPSSGRVFFEANDALTPEALDGGDTQNNIYESREGTLRLVNVLPDGSTEPNAFIGASPPGVSPSSEPNNSWRAVSEDGSRVFWTDANTGALYVRENGVSTVLVAEHATFQTAATDGSRVLYTKAGDLYEYDLAENLRTDLTPDGEVRGLAGAGEDLSYVYFVAEGALASDAIAGRENLYLYHAGATTLVAILGSSGEEGIEADVGFNARDAFPWVPALGARTAEAAPDGHSLVFMSEQSLTGYDNVNTAGSKVMEIYLFNANGDNLSCLSCVPSGERPGSTRREGNMLPLVETSDTYQLRVISEDGSRVFFDSDEDLVPQDTNHTTDVYEWERDDAGSCRSSSGCIYLLSGATSQSPSYLLDASADGSDVFFITRAQLLGQDENDLYDVYDARVGAVSPPSPTSCTGAGCQGVSASPPVFATPSSATYAGPGNFPAPAPAKPAVKGKSKPVRCKKGKKLSHGKCVKKAKAKRAKAKKFKAKKSGKSKHNKGSR
jgi:hypothetical protein